MYKLHYDVNAGKQINVVYKGMDIEVQAGENGEEGDIEIQTNKSVTLASNGTYEISPSDNYDVMKKVTATVNVPTPVVQLQESKSKYIGVNGIQIINPDSGYDAMKHVQVNVDVPGPITEANKTVSITENGTIEVYPSNGKEVMEKVTAVVNVPSSSDVEVEENKTVTITENGTVEITPSIDKDAMAKVTAVVNVSSGGGSYPLDNPTWVTNQFCIYIEAGQSGIYDALGYAIARLVYASEEQDNNKRIVIRGAQAVVQVPVIEYDYPLYYLELPNAGFFGGDQSTHPVYECKVTGYAVISENLTIGTNDSSNHAKYTVYGYFSLGNNLTLTLNGCDLYIYTDRNIGGSIVNGTHGGSVHVRTDYPYSTVGGHSVIKDLSLGDLN